MALSIDTVFDDYNTHAVPASGDKKPKKPEIRALLKQIQNGGGQSVTRNTFAALNGVTPPSENYMGIVLDDPNAALNGYYSRVSGAWVRERGFPDTFARVAVSGSGSAKTATVEAGVNPADIEVFFARITTPNTGAITLAIAGGPARQVVNVAGNALAAGEWTGVALFFLNASNQYQLMTAANAEASSAASATIAGLAADRAEAAADVAESVSDAFARPATRAGLKALNTTINTSAYLTEQGREGAFFWRVGDYAARIAADTAEGIYIKANAIAASAGAWVRGGSCEVDLRWFGAVGNGTTDDTTAVSKWLDLLILTQREGYAPAGTYKCTGAIVKTFAGISHLSIKGAGSDQTVFLFDGAGTTINGFAFTAAAGNWWFDVSPGTGMQLEGFGIATTNLNGGTGLLINSGSVEGRPQRKNNLTDIVFRGFNTFETNWDVHCDLLDAGQTWFWGCRWVMGGPTNATGIGLRLRASGDTTDPTEIHLSECQALYGSFWVKPEDHVEGIYLTQCSHVGGGVAVYWDVEAESGLHVVGGHYSNTAYNFYLKGAFDWIISNALLYLSNGSGTMYGVRIIGGGRGAINGCVFAGTSTGTQVGVVVEDSTGDERYGVSISGNDFSALTHGVLLTATSSDVTVGANGYRQIAGFPVKNDGVRNFIAPLPGKTGEYHDSIVKVVGTGSSETLNFALPAGVFNGKPKAVRVEAVGYAAFGTYEYDNGSTSATNAVVTIRDINAAALPGASLRFQISAFQ